MSKRTRKSLAPKSIESISSTAFFVSLLTRLLSEAERKVKEKESFDPFVTNLRVTLEEFCSAVQGQAPNSREIFNALSGRMTGFPLSPQAVAATLSIPLEDVRAKGEQCFSTASKIQLVQPEQIRRQWLSRNLCGFCAAKYGEAHKAGCQEEECPFCHTPLRECFCAYKHLKIKSGGLPARQWARLRRENGEDFNPREYARPLTTEEDRKWQAIIVQKGCVKYGSERRFV